MHELSIVFRIIDIAQKAAEENDIGQVSEVVLEAGEVSLVIPSYLMDCWKWAAAKSERLKSASLRIETVPAVTHCSSCLRDYPTVRYGKICPYCESHDTFLKAGGDIEVKSIAAF